MIRRTPDKKINEISFKLIEDKSILYRHNDIINHNEVDRLVKNCLINDSKGKFIIKYLDEHDRQLCLQVETNGKVEILPIYIEEDLLRMIVDNGVSSIIIAKAYQEKYEIELTKMYIKLIGLRSITMYYQNRIVD
ncbi:hypothetical protein [Clostridioides difficile]|uniref:hypothetical protein n=1 Tax=Clostridioides difficile TaxID=1496 RepID=UPI00097FDA6E|nr:hypothetical protein [Clostridioides difficile]EGT4206256.1 hypothetical protein [Clostridioides difficile]MCA0636472.1 hypothetical protein [Clostridioides difficile]MCI9908768.1 hypothetical protein [Clostridioides difficile]MCK8754306.1 hypothetical protein [Clostridioides difficile]MCO8869905.1 hypothetical protein [Clostridioides difficile]